MGTSLNSTQRKINHLLSSGAVTVTGPNQPRPLKAKTVGNSIITNNVAQQNLGTVQHCFVCDEIIGQQQAQNQLVEMQTAHTTTKFPKKIGQLVGDCFMIIVSADDVICSRCTNLINYYDRLENDIERVRTNLVGLLNKKYGLSDEGGGTMTPSPPLKMQKLNSGIGNRTIDDNDGTRIRKIVPPQHSTVTTTTPESIIPKPTPAVSAVQQLKIPQTQPVIGTPQPSTAGTSPLQRKITKIYKCLCCEYKTSDMRLFNTHYETCKQQNFQCKNCKKIYGNFGLMKQHMIREHNTAMENTCSLCHINLVNDNSLRKHMETTHATSVVVTSTTTIQTSSLAAADPGVVEQQLNASGPIAPPMNTSLYSCNQCQFKSTDKVIFDEHLRKHFGKPKPFKCRLCSQRFETKEGATSHLKNHQQPTQTSIFKCGTCSLSFIKRELLNKHIEMAHNPDHENFNLRQLQITAQTPHGKQIQQQHTQGQNILTTQKLLQDTINEALSENIGTTSVANDVADVASAASDLRFFSCQNCSLTFVNENYYNQHMETHRRDKKDGVNTTTPITTSGSSIRRNSSLNQVSSMNEGLTPVSSTKENNMNAVAQANNGQVISEVDIESIFEKMHSDKGDNNADLANASNTGNGTNGKNVVIANQEGSAGGITFNISIPQTNIDQQKVQVSNNTGVSMDMPMLDQPEEDTKIDKNIHDKHKNINDVKSKATGPPVSMPSLDDDGDTAVLQVHHQQTETAKTDLSNNVDNIKSQKADEMKEEKGRENLEAHQQAIHQSNEEAAAAALLEQHQQIPHPHHVAEANQTTIGEQGQANHGDGNSETPEQLAAAAAAAEAAASANANAVEGGEVVANAAGATEGQVAIELDEAMQAQVDSGQIKFIFNENGQLLQLDNHIITDSEGNQILVQDPEQIQQILQSVGVLQTGDGIDSETLQVVTDGNGQMVLVQGENNEAQLIDASLINADGQIVIQQTQDGEIGEAAHVIGDDGTRIPVSVSYTADGQPIVQVQHQVLEAAAAEGQQIVIEGKDGAEAAVNAGAEGDGVDGVPHTLEGSAAVTTTVTTTATAAATISSGGGFYSLEELMNQQHQQQQQQQQQQQASETKSSE